MIGLRLRWVFTVFAVGVLAGCILADLRATPTALRVPPAPAPITAFIAIVHADSHVCELRTSDHHLVATFECRPTGVQW